ncbi:DUF6512 family protein [Microbulbifer sediminum]|uniref:DUF6512 family protein n=1 Tax=Microbulbifer sediminum TaxID=2904250 RepID=UPI001F491CD1|nr:DUF6512 family protein [Microbulbifer sediminum]
MQQIPQSPHRAPGRRYQRLRTWEILGGLWILAAGFLLHSAYEWSGHWRPIAAFVPVNESVWEHLKLVFWPGVVFALLESRFLAQEATSFTTAKGLSLCCMPLVIIAGFYAYTHILGDNSLALDILIFMLSILVGQRLSYSLLVRPREARAWRLPSRAGLAFLLIAFPLFTFYPPHLTLFEHAGTGLYGILGQPAR